MAILTKIHVAWITVAHAPKESNAIPLLVFIVIMALAAGCGGDKSATQPQPLIGSPVEVESWETLRTVRIEGPTYRGEVTSVGDDGRVEFREVHEWLVLGPRTHVVWIVSGDVWTEQDTYRAHLTIGVVEQLETGSHIVRLDPSAASIVKPGDQIILDVADPNWTLSGLVPIEFVDAPPPSVLGYRHENVTSSRMRAIASALYDYFLENGYYPPAVVYGPDGTPWHSWRVLLLPLVGEHALYNAYDFNEPWDGPNNRLLVDKIPAVYQEAGARERFSNAMVATTPADEELRKNDAFRYSQSLFPLTGPRVVEGLQIEAVLNLWGKSEEAIRHDKITDGLSHILLLGIGQTDERVAWTQPVDVKLEKEMLPLGVMGSFATPYGIDGARYGLFACGDMRVIRAQASMPAQTLRSWALSNDRGRVADLARSRWTSALTTVRAFERYRHQESEIPEFIVFRKKTEYVARYRAQEPSTPPSFIKVEGVVTSEGEPILSGVIRFVPLDGDDAELHGVEATGNIVDGRIEDVKTPDVGDGLLPGSYAVLIDRVNGVPVPSRYTSLESAVIKIDVSKEEVSLEEAIELDLRLDRSE